MNMHPMNISQVMTRDVRVASPGDTIANGRPNNESV